MRRAPLAATPEMWLDRLVAETEDGFGFILTGRENETRLWAIATPMTLRGLATALEKFGTRKLADLIAPAIHYAETGFMVRPHVSPTGTRCRTEGRAPHAEFLTRFAPTRGIYARSDGRLHAVGDTLINRDMAATLRAASLRGGRRFLPRRDWPADRRRHAAAWRSARRRGSRGRQVSRRRAALGQLPRPEDRHQPAARRRRDAARDAEHFEHFDLGALGHNSPAYIAIVAEAMKIGAVTATSILATRALSMCRSSGSLSKFTPPRWPPHRAW